MPEHNEPGLIGRFAGAVTGKAFEVVPPQVVLDHIDLNELLDRVDVNQLLDRVDVNQLLDRVEVDRLLDRVDVMRLLDRVDVNEFLSDTDLEALVRRAGIPAIVAETTGSLAGGTLDTARRQLVGLDSLLTRLVDRLSRRGDTSTDVPPLLRLTPEESA